MSFIEVTKIIVPFDCVEHTYNFLKAVGKRNLEGVALWAGTKCANEFIVEYSITPKQGSYALEEGLLYSVDGEELHRINVWLHQNKLVLIAQIHSHPGPAYHSDTDDAFPIVTKEGAISIVVPDFATRPLAKEDWAIYRLLPGKGWNLLTAEEIDILLEIETN